MTIDQIKDFTKKTFKQPNIYTIDCYRRFRNRSHNARVTRFLEQVETVDPIMDYGTFRELVLRETETWDEKNPLSILCYANDAILYGYYHELARYGGEQDVDLRFPAFTRMEHGVTFGEPWRGSNNLITYCAISDYWRKKIHGISPNILYFPVGPYIHYARKYYSEQQEKELKEKLGRTLLVFPNHSIEALEQDEEISYCLLDKVFEKYAKDFDTVLVSAYWRDVGDKILAEYEKRGAKIVSAGFRSDQSFIRRLKTISSLSDAVVFDGIGTHVGFCYYLNKPVFMDGRMDPDFSGIERQVYTRFYEAFHTDSFSFTEEQKRKQGELYEEFWGGSYIRTPEEIKAILHIAREVTKRAHNVPLREFADKAVEQYLRELESRSDEEAKLEHRIMLEALER